MGFYAVLFGTAGASACRLAQQTPRMFYLLMLSQEWDMCELGEFGEWVEHARLTAHAYQLLKAILEDHNIKP